LPDHDDDDQDMVYTGTGLGHAPTGEPVEHGESDGEFSNTRDQPLPNPEAPTSGPPRTNHDHSATRPEK